VISDPILMKRDRLRRHQRPAQSIGSIVAEVMFVPSHVWPVKTRDPAMMPQSKVKDSDIAEPNARFWVTPGGSEVERMCDSSGALTAPSSEDGLDARVPQSLIPVSQPVLVFAGEKMAVRVKGVGTNLDLQSPAFEQADPHLDLLRSGGLAGDSNLTRSPGWSRRGVRVVASVVMEVQDHRHVGPADSSLHGISRQWTNVAGLGERPRGES
jgi:hypothetical protein